MTLRKVSNGAGILAIVSFIGGVIWTTQGEKAPKAEIHIGEHQTADWPLIGTVHLDTIISTVVAGALVLLLGFLARRALTKDPEDHVPTKLQLIWEAIVGQVNAQVEDNLGKVHPYAAPLAISLFFFILFANWLELLPSQAQRSTAPAVGPDRRHQPHLRPGRGDHRERVGLRHPEKGLKGLPEALLRAVPGACSR